MPPGMLSSTTTSTPASLPVSVVGGNIIVTSGAGGNTLAPNMTGGADNVVSFVDNSAMNTVTVDLPPGATTDENGGVLLCNLDELSR